MKLRITVEGKVYDVDVEVLDGGTGGPVSPPRPSAAAASAPSAAAPAPAASEAPPAGEDDERVLRSPIAGSVLQVNVAAGDAVKINQVLMVMEAMKMETNIASPQEGKIRTVHVRAGESVRQGQALVEFE